MQVSPIWPCVMMAIFADVFGIGDLRAKYPDTTEETWDLISHGEVRKGMTTDEMSLVFGIPHPRA